MLKKIQKILFIALLSISATVAIAANDNKGTIDIKSKLYVNGKLVGSPRIIVKDGQPAAVIFKDNGDEYKIILLAKEAS